MGMGIWTGMDMNGNMNGNMNGSPLVIKDGLMENHVVSWCSQRTKPPFGPEFFSRPCISKALAYAGILLVIYVYIYIDINISPLHPSLVDDTCTSKFQGILQNSYKIATFFHHVTTYPMIFPSQAYLEHHLRGFTARDTPWVESPSKKWPGSFGKEWFMGRFGFLNGGFPEPYVEP